MFQTNEDVLQRALLVAVDTGEYDVEESLDELAELARSAGAEVAARVTQRRESFDPATRAAELNSISRPAVSTR